MKLSKYSLDWARQHIIKNNDTDLFPIPFEIDVLKNDDVWSFIVDKIISIDIEKYSWKDFRSLIIPKDELSFRRAVQLDPMDSVIFSAMIYTIGSKIESNRPSPRHKVVFSYRYNPNSSGDLYDRNDGWQSFWKQGESMEEKYTHVLITDLVDFYNQIYHHNLENQFDQCGVTEEIKDSIMELCKRISLSVSRGIPIGPHASHLLAEMSMIPIDDFLHGSGYKFIRYVDDIHVFCTSKQEAEIALFDLVKILDNHQKILPNRHKTKILTREEYVIESNEKLRSIPINTFEEEMLKVMNGITSDPYEQHSYEEISDKSAFKKESLENVLDAYISQDPINFVRLKWFLRRLAQFRIPEAVEPLIDRINFLNPVIGEVGLYLRSVQENYSGSWRSIGVKILGLLDEPLVQKSEYLTIVLLGLFSRINGLNHSTEIIRKFENSNVYTKRKIILVADSANNVGWIRSIKDGYNQLDSWGKRSMIYSSRRLPKDERSFWIKRLQNNSEMEEAVAKYILNMTT